MCCVYNTTGRHFNAYYFYRLFDVCIYYIWLCKLRAKQQVRKLRMCGCAIKTICDDSPHLWYIRIANAHNPPAGVRTVTRVLYLLQSAFQSLSQTAVCQIISQMWLWRMRVHKSISIIFQYYTSIYLYRDELECILNPIKLGHMFGDFCRLHPYFAS